MSGGPHVANRGDWMVWRIVGLCALVIVATVATCAAQTASAAQQTFVRNYMAAITARDLTALKRQVHPASLACIDETNRDFFDFIFARTLGRVPPSTYRLTAVSPTGPKPPSLWPAEFARYPVQPTHQVQIDFTTAPWKYTTLVRLIAPSDGVWLEVMPCPTAEGLQAFRQKQVEAQRQRAKAEQLVEGLREPLRSELLKLLAEGGRAGAAKKYQEESGVDLETAVSVIDLIDSRAR